MASWVIRRKADGLYFAADTNIGDWGTFEEAARFTQMVHDRDVARGGRSMVIDGEEWVELDDAGQPVEAKPVRMWVVRRLPEGDFWSGTLGKWSADLSGACTHSTAEWVNPGHRENVPVLVHPDGTVTLDEPAPAVAPEESVEGYVLMRVRCPAFLRCEPVGEREWRVLGYTDDVSRATPLTLRDARSVAKAEGGLAVFLRCKSGKLVMVHGAPAVPAVPAVAQPSPYSEDEPIPYKLAADDDVQIVASTSERIGVLYADLTRMTAEVSQLERQRDEAAARLRGGK